MYRRFCIYLYYCPYLIPSKATFVKFCHLLLKLIREHTYHIPSRSILTKYWHLHIIKLVYRSKCAHLPHSVQSHFRKILPLKLRTLTIFRPESFWQNIGTYILYTVIYIVQIQGHTLTVFRPRPTHMLADLPIFRPYLWSIYVKLPITYKLYKWAYECWNVA